MEAKQLINVKRGHVVKFRGLTMKKLNDDLLYDFDNNELVSWFTLMERGIVSGPKGFDTLMVAGGGYQLVHRVTVKEPLTFKQSRVCEDCEIFKCIEADSYYKGYTFIHLSYNRMLALETGEIINLAKGGKHIEALKAGTYYKVRKLLPY